MRAPGFFPDVRDRWAAGDFGGRFMVVVGGLCSVRASVGSSLQASVGVLRAFTRFTYPTALAGFAEDRFSVLRWLVVERGRVVVLAMFCFGGE